MATKEKQNSYFNKKGYGSTNTRIIKRQVKVQPLQGLAVSFRLCIPKKEVLMLFFFLEMSAISLCLRNW